LPHPGLPAPDWACAADWQALNGPSFSALVRQTDWLPCLRRQDARSTVSSLQPCVKRGSVVSQALECRSTSIPWHEGGTRRPPGSRPSQRRRTPIAGKSSNACAEAGFQRPHPTRDCLIPDYPAPVRSAAIAFSAGANAENKNGNDCANVRASSAGGFSRRPNARVRRDDPPGSSWLWGLTIPSDTIARTRHSMQPFRRQPVPVKPRSIF